MSKSWETKEGKQIYYSKLSKKHLLNILKWIKKRATDGMTIMVGGGCWEAGDMWFDEYEIDGEEVLERYDYKGLLKEAKKRKIIK